MPASCHVFGEPIAHLSPNNSLPSTDHNKLKPALLLLTTTRWFPTARLAVALARSGFSVEAICPNDHPMRKTGAVTRFYAYDSLAPLASIEAALTATRKDLLVPGDDLATSLLRALHERSSKKNESICKLIERSIGPAESFPYVCARAKLMKLASEEDIRIPRTEVARDLARQVASEHLSFPMVLKVDGTSSGEGVRIVRSNEEAERAFKKLQAPPSIIRALKRAIIDHDLKLVAPVLLRRKNTVNLQEFVQGRDATSLVACWEGAPLAALQFEVVKKQYANGPASVMQRIDNAEMTSAAAKIIRRLRLSGLYGFDFLLEERTGHAYLIEMNPRPTQVGHLNLGPGSDLPAALYAAVTGQPLLETPAVTDSQTIALFPQEWTRNPASCFLQSAYHDIPWDEPELIRAGTRKSNGFVSRYRGKKWAQILLANRVPPAND